MRDVRRLPPLVRVVGIFGLLLPLAACALNLQMLRTRLATSEWPMDVHRVDVITGNLIVLGLQCTLITAIFRARLREQGREPVLPDGWWRSPLRVLMAAAALPLGAIAGAVVIPSTQPGFGIVLFLSLLVGVVNLVVYVWVWARYLATSR